MHTKQEQTSNTKLAVISRATPTYSMLNSLCASNKIERNSIERAIQSKVQFNQTRDLIGRAKFDRTANVCKQRKI